MKKKSDLSMKHLYNWISIKKLLTIMFLLLLLFFLIYSVYTYHTLEASKVVDGDKTEQFVLEETELISIENIYQFQGEEAFHIVAGKNDAGDERSEERRVGKEWLSE